MIKTIVFDFGDVFINLNKKAPLIELNRLGISSFDNKMLQLNIDYEIGLISTRTFIDSYIKLFPTLNTVTISAAWNAIILDFPEHRLKFIEALSESKKFQLILLSNTNELHIKKVFQKMTMERYLRFKNCFDFFYLSHEINLRKPETTIFDFVLKTHKLESEECLFIDDTLEHIETAKKMGFHTWNLDPDKEDIVDLFILKKELF